jgi:hypothetical protein
MSGLDIISLLESDSSADFEGKDLIRDMMPSISDNKIGATLAKKLQDGHAFPAFFRAIREEKDQDVFQRLMMQNLTFIRTFALIDRKHFLGFFRLPFVMGLLSEPTDFTVPVAKYLLDRKSGTDSVLNIPEQSELSEYLTRILNSMISNAEISAMCADQNLFMDMTKISDLTDATIKGESLSNETSKCFENR